MEPVPVIQDCAWRCGLRASRRCRPAPARDTASPAPRPHVGRQAVVQEPVRIGCGAFAGFGEAVQQRCDDRVFRTRHPGVLFSGDGAAARSVCAWPSIARFQVGAPHFKSDGVRGSDDGGETLERDTGRNTGAKASGQVAAPRGSLLPEVKTKLPGTGAAASTPRIDPWRDHQALPQIPSISDREVAGKLWQNSPCRRSQREQTHAWRLPCRLRVRARPC